MYSLFRKEIKQFLGSLIGYLAVLVFLLMSGLFLWVFPGTYNIPDNGYATLEGLFSLAPWLYLFLIPAITMRFFADEKRTGTIEILLTHPISDFKLVLAKFLAGMVLVLFSLLPTLIYFYSVYQLGNPVGSVDAGATWGSFVGLFFLAAIYLAIGIFASSLTDNQIISFILAVIISFVFYLGFDFIATSEIPYLFEQIISWISINNHYLSVSRGVIDLRDMIYFLGMTLLFLQLSTLFIRVGKFKLKKTRVNLALFSLGLLLVFFVSTNFLYRIDLTADKRYSLSQVSKQIAADIDSPVSVELFLSGELQPGLRNLQQEIIEKVAVLNAFSSSPIRIRFTNPYSISNVQKRQEFIEEISRKGVVPTNFQQKTNQGISTKLIFPGAIVSMAGKEIAVNFLKFNPDFGHEANFNHSAESVEFELVNAIQKLQRTKKSSLAFLEGHGELNKYQLGDISRSLSSDFSIRHLSALQIASEEKPDILIIADPNEPFPEIDKFYIDQYIMNGGKVMWLIDPVKVSLDSLTQGFQTYAFPKELNLSDQLFRYGVRLNAELVQDVECAFIKIDVSVPGSQPKLTDFPWYYSPLLVPADNHPATKNINRIFSEFASTVDTVSNAPNVKKQVVLTTTPYARSVKSPSSVSLQNVNNPPARELFNQSFLPVGVLLEGEFNSVFTNRFLPNLGVSENEIIPKSKPTKMLVIADGDMIANRVYYSTTPPRIEELGYDRVSKQTFANKEFLLNLIYYMNDEQGIMQLRNRSLKLRLLDKVKLREQKAKWQWLNVGFPVFLILLFALVFNLIRKHRFAR